jgi:DNA-binding NtrC family response regulator
VVVRRMSSGRAHNMQVRVLVVEDHIALANRIGEGLRDAGFAIHVVYDGAVALESAASTAYDVVVLDRDLPAVHGDRVCRRLVRDGSPSRILMLTGSTGWSWAPMTTSASRSHSPSWSRASELSGGADLARPRSCTGATS